MTRAPKKPPKGAAPDNQDGDDQEPKGAESAPAKFKLQFGPTASAPGSRLKKTKG